MSDELEQIERQLRLIDTQIYNYQSQYLERTKNTGNIIKGFETYIHHKTTKIELPFRKQPMDQRDRLFSYSSVTCKASLNLQLEVNNQLQNLPNHDPNIHPQGKTVVTSSPELSGNDESFRLEGRRHENSSSDEEKREVRRTKQISKKRSQR